MVRALLISLALALAASAPAAAAAPDRCPRRPGERVLARSLLAVVTEHERPFARAAAPGATVHAVVGCSRATGRRRVIVREERYDGQGNRSHGVRLAGTAIAYVTTLGTTVIGSSLTTLIADDAVHGGRRRVLDEAYEPSTPAAYRPGPDGTVAWLRRSPSGADRLRVWRAATGARTVDSGFTLRGPVRLARDGMVRWLHGGTERQAPVALPPGPCGRGPRHDGTDAVDTLVEGGVLTACRRATGTTVRVPVAAAQVIADVAGPYVALATREAIVRIDLVTGTAESIPLRSGARGDVVVDPAGSLAWTETAFDPAQPVRTLVRVRDGDGGTRVVATVDGVASLTRDDRTVVVDPGRVTIVLDP